MRDEMAIEALSAENDRRWCEYSLGGMYDPEDDLRLYRQMVIDNARELIPGVTDCHGKRLEEA